MTKEEIIGKLGFSIGRNILDKTFMMGLRNAIDALSEPERFGAKWTERMIASFLPNISAWMARTLDADLKDPANIGEVIAERIPIVRAGVRPKLDIWGRPIEVGTGELPFLTPTITRAISPVRPSKAVKDNVDEEIVRLKLRIGMPSKRIGGKVLTEDDYYDYVRLAGITAKKRLDQIINSSDYKQLSDVERERIIRDVINDARYAARQVILANIIIQEQRRAK